MEDSPLARLPEEITLNILSRLPAELVLDCKQVCRVWRNFIRFHANTTYFAYQHLERHHGCGLLSSQQNLHPRELDHSDGSDSAPMTFIYLEGSGPQELYYAQFHEDDEVHDNQPNYNTKRIDINLDFLYNVCEIVGSCNGLICLSPVERKHKCLGSRPGRPLYIINPITKEIVNLPGLSMDQKKRNNGHIAQGFGYLPVTNEYKVIRVCYVVDQSFKVRGQVEVYTLGSGSGWRLIGETSYNLCLRYADWETTSGVWFNCSIHWLHEEPTGIVAFDLLTEDFKVLPTPTDRLTAPCRRSLRVTRGSLCCVCAYFEKGSWESDCWFLRKNKEEIGNCSYHRKKLYNKSWSMLNYSFGSKLSFAVTRRGETLVAGQGLVRRYDLETRTWKEIWQSEYGGSSFWVIPMLHINSFVSLKALGERSAKTFKESRDGDDILMSSGSKSEARRCAKIFKESWDGDNILISSGSRRKAKRFK